LACFAEEYVKQNGNGTSEAAGYSPNSAAVIAARNLRKLNIEQRIADSVDQAGITNAEIIGNLAEISRASVSDLLDQEGNFDLNFIRAANLGHLVKSVTVRETPDG
jgi:phage terminase small subunit